MQHPWRFRAVGSIGIAHSPQPNWHVFPPQYMYSSLSHLSCFPVSVIGGGYLGTEVALALASRRLRVCHVVCSSYYGQISCVDPLMCSQIYAEPGPLWQELPSYVSMELRDRLAVVGVHPLPERLVTNFTPLYKDPNDDFEEEAPGLISWDISLSRLSLPISTAPIKPPKPAEGLRRRSTSTSITKYPGPATPTPMAQSNRFQHSSCPTLDM